MTIDRSAWSGDGDFTIELVSVLEEMAEIAGLHIEDAPSSHAGSGYTFIVNEVVVTFATERRASRTRWLGFLPVPRQVAVPRLTLAGLEARLAADRRVGPPDYSDDGMLQYLRAERVVPPYQTRGYKAVEMVRIYGAPQR